MRCRVVWSCCRILKSRVPSNARCVAPTFPMRSVRDSRPISKQAFGAALPVGVGGTEEIFDVQLTEYVAPDKALDRLRAASAADLMPYKACYITKDVPAASVAYPFSTYRADAGLR